MKSGSSPGGVGVWAPAPPMGDTTGAEAVCIRWGRIAALMVMVGSVANWLGWATDQEILTRIFRSWPPMTPWTALWLFALASAVLIMSTGSGPRWVGPLLAALLALSAVAVLAQYATRQSFGLDRAWFGQTLADVQSSWPGRPSPMVAVATVLMSMAIGVSSTERRWARRCWGICLTSAMAIAGVMVIAYLFGAFALVATTPSAEGVALAAVLGLLLAGLAATLTRPTRDPVAWVLTANRWITVRLFVLVPGGLLVVGILRRIFLAFGHDHDMATALAIAVGALCVGAAMFKLSRLESDLFQTVATDRALLRAVTDGMLDLQVLLEAVRDPDGRVVDLIYRSVNRAACQYFQRSEHELLGLRNTEVAPETVDRGLMALVARCLDDGRPVELDDLEVSTSFFPEPRRYDLRAGKAGADLITVTVRDVTERHDVEARLAASEQHYRLLAENVGDVIARIRNDTFVWISPSVEDVLGGPPAYWVGRKVTEFIPPRDSDTHSLRLDGIAAGGSTAGRIRVISLDGTTHWAHLNAKPFFDANGHQDGFVAAIRLIDGEVAAQQASEAALKAAAQADVRYRRAIAHSAAGMAMLTRDGKFEEVNDALCNLLGYPREVLLQKSFKDVTAAEYIDQSVANFEDLLAARQDSIRSTKQYIHADGHRIWGELTATAIPDEHGPTAHFLAQIIDITALTEANSRNRALAYHLQELTERLTAELSSAAAYMSSIMPHSLTGKVNVSSCYLPSRELGGDCFDYRWIDDDHLLVYLIDVSGHGLQPALLAVSIHNLLRSGSLTTETLLSPEQTLAALNNLFRMDRQSNLYFTAWFGIFQDSTRTLRYASAGAPPALALTPGSGRPEKPTELSTPCPPVGILADTPFVENTYNVPEDCQLLIYSDGAFELTSDAPPMPIGDFTNLVSRVAASPRWSLDQLVHQLQEKTSTGTFEDDCSLILLTLP